VVADTGSRPGTPIREPRESADRESRPRTVIQAGALAPVTTEGGERRSEFEDGMRDTSDVATAIVPALEI
jgi:hypothetical protein